jgi:membrane-bound serine protease (ClpP class)
MTRRAQVSLWLALCGLLLAIPAGAVGEDGETAPSIELSGTIDPATEKWIDAALGDAEDDGAALALIRIDTPGGLDSSMREIVKDVLEAPFPVVVYVSPNGARAASAGAFIAEAADVAAMAPQTNIGSASAVTASGGDIGGTLGRKIENDAAAFMRALAESHGRNGPLAERMVTEAANFSADEALERDLVDLVAANEDELLAALDGFRVSGPKAQRLDTQGLRIEQRDMPFQYQALQLLVNPTIAYVLLLLGLVGIAIEIFSPGLILPGTLGLVSLLLGAYGTAQLPVKAAGVLLLVVGVAFIIAEAQLPTHGIIGAVGVLALALSGLLLFDTGSEQLEVSVPVVVTVALLVGGFLAFAAAKAVQARRAPVITGWEELVGAAGEVRVPLDPVGQVFVNGALWRASLNDEGADAVERGARVRVESVDGLTLRVSPLPEEAEKEQWSV